jgi:hypothetical protein
MIGGDRGGAPEQAEHPGNDGMPCLVISGCFRRAGRSILAACSAYHFTASRALFSMAGVQISVLARAHSQAQRSRTSVLLLRWCRPLRCPISCNAAAYVILDATGTMLISSRSVSA